jgi:hypothetical protein
VSENALEIMAAGTQGYPFLIQLVGAQTWRLRRTARNISAADARTGVENARRRLGSLVHAPALKEASDIDKSFLLDKGYASVYRQRLIDAELIETARYGYVGFTLPYLREYLREHATAHTEAASTLLERCANRGSEQTALRAQPARIVH